MLKANIRCLSTSTHGDQPSTELKNSCKTCTTLDTWHAMGHIWLPSLTAWRPSEAAVHQLASSSTCAARLPVHRICTPSHISTGRKNPDIWIGICWTPDGRVLFLVFDFFQNLLRAKLFNLSFDALIDNRETQSSTSSTMTKSARHDPVEHSQGKERMGRQRLVHPTQVSHWCFLPQDTPSTWQQTTQRENSYLAP